MNNFALYVMFLSALTHLTPTSCMLTVGSRLGRYARPVRLNQVRTVVPSGQKTGFHATPQSRSWSWLSYIPGTPQYKQKKVVELFYEENPLYLSGRLKSREYKGWRPMDNQDREDLRNAFHWASAHSFNGIMRELSELDSERKSTRASAFNYMCSMAMLIDLLKAHNVDLSADVNAEKLSKFKQWTKGKTIHDSISDEDLKNLMFIKSSDFYNPNKSERE